MLPFGDWSRPVLHFGHVGFVNAKQHVKRTHMDMLLWRRGAQAMRAMSMARLKHTGKQYGSKPRTNTLAKSLSPKSPSDGACSGCLLPLSTEKPGSALISEMGRHPKPSLGRLIPFGLHTVTRHSGAP